MQLLSILSTIFSFYYLVEGANAAFAPNVAPAPVSQRVAVVTTSGSSSQSRLFRTVPASPLLFSSPMMKRRKIQPLHKMASSDEEEEVKTEVVGGKSQNKEKVTGGTFNSNNNGFLTALFLAPPLIAKFGIVILVKIVTDLVVFPLLFLYRLCQTIKSKVVGLVKSDDFKGDKINGAT
mmetsp:Transcript_15911/g.20200  ORF Transcript_15911/g.20200 Transcript_15911/m.20200 type:complete len:178 (-) Transcript_15911:299-832(-)|eukprot:CAMPEP_0203634962 /NCGR_PEP_ID=MMETSP0088-20131115/1813_1 /ASSEMBLY_ACC=CAM_ASM_001087 /TAXON_ID=426623 /ORGANISM="Chaetoceros affinis, Strain CCMP159" /LENGTH=177 /DNA_ID=CAMNT_0050488681 /DNA_START=128 /DNA_END=661 /DNA_ORIENTATION=-